MNELQDFINSLENLKFNQDEIQKCCNCLSYIYNAQGFHPNGILVSNVNEKFENEANILMDFQYIKKNQINKKNRLKFYFCEESAEKIGNLLLERNISENKVKVYEILNNITYSILLYWFFFKIRQTEIENRLYTQKGYFIYDYSTLNSIFKFIKGTNLIEPLNFREKIKNIWDILLDFNLIVKIYDPSEYKDFYVLTPEIINFLDEYFYQKYISEYNLYNIIKILILYSYFFYGSENSGKKFHKMLESENIREYELEIVLTELFNEGLIDINSNLTNLYKKKEPLFQIISTMEKFLNKLLNYFFKISDFKNLFSKYITVLDLDDDLYTIEEGLDKLEDDLYSQKVEKEDYERTLAHCKKIVNVQQTNEKAWGLMGYCYSHLRRFTEAKDCYEKALKINQNNLDTINELIDFSFILGENQKGLDYFNQAIKINQNYIRTWELMGNIYWQNLFDYENAIYYFEKVVEIDPKNHYWHSLGVLYNNIGEYQKAINAFEKYFKLDPDYTEMWETFGPLYWREKKYDNAIKWYKIGIEEDPRDKYTWFELSEIYEETGNWQKALECIMKTKELDPEDKDILENFNRLNAKYIREINKLPSAYDEITFEKLNQKLGINTEIIENLVEKAIFNGDVNGKIKGNTLIFGKKEIKHSLTKKTEVETKINDMIKAFEKRLRTFLEKTFTEQNENWWQDDISLRIQEETIERLEKQKKVDEELGVLNKSYDKIDFLDFSRYIEIIISKRNWELFKDIFYDKNRIHIYFKEISNTRNAIAHHRKIVKDSQSICKAYIRRILSQIEKAENG